MISKHMHHFLRSLICLLLVTGLFFSCGPSKAEKEAAIRQAALDKAAAEKIAAQKAVLAEAIKGLRKIEAATQVGVNYTKYGELLIEAKALVNEALIGNHIEALENRFNTVMDWYADAGTIWGQRIRKGDWIFDRDWDMELIMLANKYNLIKNGILPITDKHVDPMKIVQYFWANASIELAAISSMVLN